MVREPHQSQQNAKDARWDERQPGQPFLARLQADCRQREDGETDDPRRNDGLGRSGEPAIFGRHEFHSRPSDGLAIESAERQLGHQAVWQK